MSAGSQTATALALKQILIIEDATDIQLLLAKLLEGFGYSVSVANDGQEAIELLRSADVLPQLIILDLMMPVMDGYEFRAEQERDSRLAGIPVLAMTAWADVQGKAAKIGAKAYLKKPFADVQTILDTVRQFFPEET